jgi:hypothetical protein
MVLLEDEVVRLDDASKYAVLPGATPFSTTAAEVQAIDLLLGTQVRSLVTNHLREAETTLSCKHTHILVGAATCSLWGGGASRAGVDSRSWIWPPSLRKQVRERARPIVA